MYVTGGNTTGAGTIFEYAHGGTSPIQALSDPGIPSGCAVDPTTGALAVANIYDQNNPYYRFRGDVAIYPNAEGQPTMYYARNPRIGSFFYCGYDDAGHLYLTGTDNNSGGQSLLTRLNSESNSFQIVRLPVSLKGTSSVQWDGKRMTVTSGTIVRTPLSVYRLRVSGNEGKVVGTTVVSSHGNNYHGQTWIQGGNFIGLSGAKGAGEVLFWRYPRGGKPNQHIPKIPARLNGIVMSVASTATRQRSRVAGGKN
ncbi:MAG TPA: hypothetical protein VIX83_02020 [Candidatus Cybelea sp.]